MSMNYMSTERILLKGDYLLSNNGQFKAIFQTDGNFVLYGWGRVVWASNTVNKDAQRLILQQDGNLVIYTTQDHPIWASHTARCNNRQRGHLTLTDKGTLELYGDREVIWKS
ncbi:mannose-specific lectin isoform X1 [Salmo salar]|uniref:Mannose-specific lectin n=1 Tax=Salmo salar TaxID=8030 RepID=B5X9U1_SALSA|nr:Mannose-specific lectin [Salmo salar]XP_014057348.1 mannose-specific lectin isoform X1 [Salmo salar]ACI67611.1 Mannose-specific lectin precursor [Salmo salar]ACI68398.1 Mannose-specific lectin precursor [Salmo salar]ADM15973.1 Mannose-specific lectin precursor [Salmo salar]|eukprot:NP_001134458.1 Mannose-specific lectin [Salmo salar]